MRFSALLRHIKHYENKEDEEKQKSKTVKFECGHVIEQVTNS